MLFSIITSTVDIVIFLTVLRLSFFFFRRTSASKKGLDTAQIEFLSLKATTLVGHGSPSLVLRPFRSTIEGRMRMRQPARGASRGRGLVGAGNEGSSLG